MSMNEQQGPGATNTKATGKSRSFSSFHLLAAGLMGIFVVGVVVALFIQPLRCMLEFRLSEGVLAIFLALASGAISAITSFPHHAQQVFRWFFAGLAIASIGTVFVVVLLPPPAAEECFLSGPGGVITPLIIPPTCTLHEPPTSTVTPELFATYTAAPTGTLTPTVTTKPPTTFTVSPTYTATLIIPRTPTITPIEANTPTPIETVTAKPPTTFTVSPTYTATLIIPRTPTITPIEANTPTPVETLAPTAIVEPTVTLTVPPPKLLSPLPGETQANPVIFRWEGLLHDGQSYIVRARSARTGYAIQSPPLSDTSWGEDFDLPGDAFGEWRWSVTVVEGDTTIMTSTEGTFWFQPLPPPPPTASPRPTFTALP